MSDTTEAERVEGAPVDDHMTDTAEGGAVPGATDAGPAFRLGDFATGAGAGAPNAEPAPAPSLEPYTDEEIAQLTAFAFGFGLPLDVLDEYTKTYISRALPLLGVLDAGGALAELGVHKGAGIGAAPAWMRAAAAGVGLGLVGLMTRRQYAGRAKGAGDEVDDWSSTPGGADVSEPGMGGADA